MNRTSDEAWAGAGTRLHFEFYGGLGLAITQWANLELAIFWVFSHAFAHPDRGRAAEVFYATQFHQKVSMTTQALESSGAAPDALAEWKQLVERARRLSQSRNKLAHWVVTGNASDDGDDGDDGDDRYRLHPPGEGFSYSGALTAKDFSVMWASFNELASAIEEFWNRLAGRTP